MDLAHPFQRSGAWAAALMRGRAHPAELTDDDLDRQAERIAADCERAGRLAKGEPGWAWLVRLAGMFPQSPPTHPSRNKNPASIGARVLDFLAPDPGPAPGRPAWPCWSCGAPAVTVKWGKDKWPLTDLVSHLNGTSQYGGGLPSCRECRIAVWSMPYATATVGRLHLTVNPASGRVARAVSAAHLAVNEQALSEGWVSWRQGPPAEDRLWQVLAETGEPCFVEVLRWQSGNRDSELISTPLTEEMTGALISAYRDCAEDLRAAAWRAARAHPVTLVADRERLAAALRAADLGDADLLRKLADDVALGLAAAS
jgi:hypothetical protein